ncbi:lysophospholipid acyltransferase family protein [Cupriavidus taiwanensis]|uniref:Phospholipid/glycerol acyltransferase n=2 Tax=Cupriavidus taiwanensis TaxID=164546 RepID=B3R2E1_CUPTR|nr:lysophospholipid acyltransferase family protein [Cupriavidus taiwanensis]CAQ69658.1 putative Phospholipid/glycerol acyltransferase [Cupriavidus taiwanensis LMG 19424]SOY44789.1 putative Phospholipid/glycerol acyltransferase [Cupriavidus taiwanensis]SOY87691.1 putative Phospholipid/glycerol acyltransferase [Cupriavidus taiwanensis]SOZ05560.1 putative Phospholipid/glycerol acyltransferase [Cupriavidus taiwanensis]SOZ07544.1 putative Phospholipid/glycerol acyltransferase [Cupriavidus taiwanens
MWLARATARAIIVFARLLTGMRANWQGCIPAAVQRVYFANHSSHGDFVLIWGCLPPDLRAVTRPVAGADYWQTSPLRRFIGRDVFRALLIDRTRSDPGCDPVALMQAGLAAGDSLILFPEGTRNTTDARLLPFKSGIYHLARACPEVEFVPVWIDNLNRVMPKGEVVPVPLLCTVTFGQPLRLAADDSKEAFLARCREGLLALAPELE